MQGLAAASILLLLGISLVIGIRLLALWSRTRGMPELLLGTMLLLISGIGYPGQIVSSRIESASVVSLYLLGYGAVSAGIALLYLFTWRVFRAQERWALVFACAGAALLGFNVFERARDVLVSHDVRLGAETMWEGLLQAATVTAAYLWTAWESLRHHGMMKRRVRLGLADPVLANRFLLWGAMSLFASMGIVWSAAAFGMGMDVMNNPVVLVPSSVSGIAQAVLLLLALMPPQWYLERVRSPGAVDAVPQES